MVGEENIQVKTEVKILSRLEHCQRRNILQVPESSPASEALQLIFADSGLDGKSIMLDLTKLLNDDPNLASQVRSNSYRGTGHILPSSLLYLYLSLLVSLLKWCFEAR